jgi:cytosine deaminase
MPTYVNGHIQLDKSFLQAQMRPNKDYSFGECLELTWEHKARYTTEDILERAGRCVEEGIRGGTTAFRAFADVDSIGKLRGLEGLLALRDQWRDLARIEVVAFPTAIRSDPPRLCPQDALVRQGGRVSPLSACADLRTPGPRSSPTAP